MRRRSAITAAFAVLLLVVGQLAALAHEAETRHVTCAEHGEELEAATLAESVSTDRESRLVGVEGGGGEHHDCPILRALHQTTDIGSGPTLIQLDFALATAMKAVASATFIAVDLYRIAPKTSPPV
jgi:hypothetical protein